MAGFAVILGSSVDALVMSPFRVLSPAVQPTLSVAAPFIPKGPFGNYRSASDSTDEGWVGDRSRSAQIAKFEKGEDYLFFQGPSPQFAIQPDLPGVLTGENLANALEDPPVVQLGAAAVAGVGSLAAVGQVLLA